jgi:uncharacterized membrane protein
VNRNHAFAVCLVLTVISAAVAAYYYGRLPAVMPTHWNASGHVNGHMPKFWGVVIYPAIMLALCVQLALLPLISPNKFRLDNSIGTFSLIVVVIAIFILVVSVLAMQAALGTPLPIQNLVPALLGLLFFVIGNYMGKFRKNFFMGIRTPWTLASDEVWARTNRLAGWLWAAGGLVFIVESIVGVNVIAILSVVGIMLLVPMVYSFFAYKQIEGFKQDASL